MADTLAMGGRQPLTLEAGRCRSYPLGDFKAEESSQIESQTLLNELKNL